MRHFALNSVFGFALAALASVGLIIPTAALPCCGCCTDGAAHSENVGACCSQRQACCEAKSEKTLSPCCHGTDSCGGPECTCHVLPARALPVDVRSSEETLESADSLVFLALARLPSTVDLLRNQSLPDGAAMPHFGGGVRLHSKLCVWRN